MPRFLFALSGTLGFFGVALGAFGAHALAARFASLPDGPRSLELWRTAAQYHVVHALAVGLAAVLAESRGGKAATVAGLAFGVGVVVFSGSLYTMALTGQRWLGAITPFGGLAFLLGWAALAFAGTRS